MSGWISQPLCCLSDIIAQQNMTRPQAAGRDYQHSLQLYLFVFAGRQQMEGFSLMSHSVLSLLNYMIHGTRSGFHSEDASYAFTYTLCSSHSQSAVPEQKEEICLDIKLCLYQHSQYLRDL